MGDKITMRALITGIRGMDGSYLAEHLLNFGYEVWGLQRRQAVPHSPNIDHIKDQLHLVYGDLSDQTSLEQAIKVSQPDEIYNLAAQSFVGESWRVPIYTFDTDATGPMRLFEAARQVKPDARIYQASSSEMFGATGIHSVKMNEEYPMLPCSPYGCAKLAAHNMARIYRRSYGTFISSGILFNHEGPRRGKEFVTRKVTSTLARIAAGSKERLSLGNLNSYRDWGYAKEYVQAMRLMLGAYEADDFVIATGQAHSIRDMVQVALDHFGLTWDVVDVNSAEMRPYDVQWLCGDPSKARHVLTWKPTTLMPALIRKMCSYDAEVTKIDAQRG